MYSEFSAAFHKVWRAAQQYFLKLFQLAREVDIELQIAKLNLFTSTADIVYLQFNGQSSA